jgi:hypothetical protein
MALDFATNQEIIYVSNHGGRQLDHARAAIDMLPEIVDAVRGRAEIVLDGGIVRGGGVPRPARWERGPSPPANFKAGDSPPPVKWVDADSRN